MKSSKREKSDGLSKKMFASWNHSEIFANTMSVKNETCGSNEQGVSTKYAEMYEEGRNVSILQMVETCGEIERKYSD